MLMNIFSFCLLRIGDASAKYVNCFYTVFLCFCCVFSYEEVTIFLWTIMFYLSFEWVLIHFIFILVAKSFLIWSSFASKWFNRFLSYFYAIIFYFPYESNNCFNNISFTLLSFYILFYFFARPFFLKRISTKSYWSSTTATNSEVMLIQTNTCEVI